MSYNPEVRINLRPIAVPLPLGFMGLAGATFAVSALQLGWIPAKESVNVALILIAFVFPVQLVASVFGFLSRDSVAATGMGILAGTWLSVGLVMLHSPPGSVSRGLGMLLFVNTAGMLIPALSAWGAKLIPALVLTTTAARFAVTGVYQFTNTNEWKTAAGVVGVVLGVLAVYAALAMELENTSGKTVLPLGRVGRGRKAQRGTLDDQLSGLVHEPGVRQQL